MPLTDLPAHYRTTLRCLLRFAAVMTIVGLLTGVLFQESSKKLSPAEVGAGLQLAATLRLALVHGHVLTTAVLLPIALAAALVLGRLAGGAELTARTLRWLTRGYLPLVCAALALMLYKAYHVLISVRLGNTDLEAIDEQLFAGQTALRHALYGLTHVGLALTLGVFAVALWRSLAERAMRRPQGS